MMEQMLSFWHISRGCKTGRLISNGGNSTNRGRILVFVGCKWEGEVSINKNFLVTELKIPLSSLRYDDKASKWRINIYKTDIGKNIVSSWSKKWEFE